MITKHERLALLANVPYELTQQPRWVGYKLIPSPKRAGKIDKLPYSPVTGRLAAVNDPGTWTSFQDAVAFVEEQEDIHGVGIVLTGDGLVAVDLDNCVDGSGSIAPWAAEIVDTLQSYTEFSPSRTGIHILVWGTLPDGRKRRGGIEMYADGRYMTITGNIVPGTSPTLAERSAVIAEVYDRHLGSEPSPSNGSEHVPSSGGVQCLDDQEVLDKMFGSAHGECIQRLWNGDLSQYDGDQSAADLALCNHLAYWTDRNPEQMDRLFRQSQLYRPKWDKVHRGDGATYGQMTIECAIESTPRAYMDMKDIIQRLRWPQAGSSGVNGSLPDEQLEHLYQEGWHDSGHAVCVHTLFGNQFAYSTALGWLQYTGTHWEGKDAEFAVNRAVSEMLLLRRQAAAQLGERGTDPYRKSEPSTQRKENVKYAFRDLVMVSVGEFDKDPDVLNCRNGVIDLRTGDLVAHEPSNRFTYCVPVAYQPNAAATEWLHFLAQVVKDWNDLEDWLQMACGYSITGRTTEECMFYIYGPTRSGKGTFTTALLNLLGEPLAQGANFSTFTQRRDGDSQNFDLAPLRPARLVFASESGRYQTLNEAAVKAITGNDPIRAAYKYRDHFSYVPQYKIWLASNHPVRGDVDDDAFWSRIRVIEFPHSYLNREDKGLKRYISSPDVLTGILAWAVAGANRWYTSQTGLMTPQPVCQSTQGQRYEQDYVKQWLEECIVAQVGAFSPIAVLYGSYRTWCEANGLTPKTSGSLGKALTAKGLVAGRQGKNGVLHRGYHDIVVRHEDQLSLNLPV